MTFIDAIQTGGYGLTRSRLDRLQKELSTFIADREHLTHIVAALMTETTVQAGLENAKNEVVADFERSKTELLSKRDSLQREVRQLESSKRKVHEQIKEEASEVSLAVRTAFEKAKNAGIETLAQAAVFESVMTSPRRLEATSKASGSLELTEARLSHLFLERSPDDAIGHLRSIGFRASDAQLLYGLSSLSIDKGLAIAIIGTGANVLATALARLSTNARVAVVDIGIGLMSPHSMAEALNAIGSEADTVVLRGANCSDFSAYGVNLEECMVRRLTDPKQLPKLYFSMSRGPSSLPVDATIADSALLIDLSLIGAPETGVASRIDDISERLDGSGRSALGRLKAAALRAVVQDAIAGTLDVSGLSRLLTANI